jgi:hypothetical protein
MELVFVKGLKGRYANLMAKMPRAARLRKDRILEVLSL